jgi:hypothetical protein
VVTGRGNPLRGDDLRDLAGRPQAAMRGLRRRLMRVMIARMAQCHPDAITIGRGPGEPLIRRQKDGMSAWRDAGPMG